MAPRSPVAEAVIQSLPGRPGLGVPADGVRDTPDVSLFASAGFFGAFYIVCQQSTNADGQPCSIAAPAYDFAGYGGTSVSSPAFAGILSLVNQKTGSRQGNANYVLYNLASQQNKAGTACSAITGTPAAGCVFNDVTTDTISMPCLKGTPNCTVTNSERSYGVLSGYSASAGYDLATGLGSVNAANLVNNWSNADFVATSTTLTLSPATITHGSAVSANVKVTSTSGTPTGSVSINALASNGSVQSGTLQGGSYSASLSNFPGGTYSVQAHYAGDGTFAPSDSNPQTLTVTPEASTTTLQALLYNPSTGTTTTANSGASFSYGGFFLLRADVAGVSGQGSATGDILLTDSGTPVDGGTFRLNSTSNTEDQTRSLAPGTHVLAAAYFGDASFNPSTSSAVVVTITKGQTTSILQATPSVLSAASTLTVTAQVNARGFGTGGQKGFGASAPTGLISFSSGGVTLGSAVLLQNFYPASSTDSGTVTLAIPASLLPVGSNDITFTYSGDSNYAASTSSGVAVTVTGSTQATSTTTLRLSSATVTLGQSYSFSAASRLQQPPRPGSYRYCHLHQRRPVNRIGATLVRRSQCIQWLAHNSAGYSHHHGAVLGRHQLPGISLCSRVLHHQRRCRSGCQYHHFNQPQRSSAGNSGHGGDKYFAIDSGSDGRRPDCTGRHSVRSGHCAHRRNYQPSSSHQYSSGGPTCGAGDLLG